MVMAKEKKKPKAELRPDDEHPVLVRMKHCLWEELSRDAEENSRKINGHILWLIKERLKIVRKNQGDV